jgi:hypothetical protein
MIRCGKIAPKPAGVPGKLRKDAELAQHQTYLCTERHITPERSFSRETASGFQIWLRPTFGFASFLRSPEAHFAGLFYTAAEAA